MSDLILTPTGVTPGETPEPAQPAPETPADEIVAAPVEGSTEGPSATETVPADAGTSAPAEDAPAPAETPVAGSESATADAETESPAEGSTATSSEESSEPPVAPFVEPITVGNAVGSDGQDGAPDVPIYAETTATAPEADGEHVPAVDTTDEPDVIQAQGGVLENLNLKPDSSPQALEQLFLEGEHITEHLLDEIEKRSDVGDVKYLVGFCRRALAELKGQS